MKRAEFSCKNKKIATCYSQLLYHTCMQATQTTVKLRQTKGKRAKKVKNTTNGPSGETKKGSRKETTGLRKTEGKKQEPASATWPSFPKQ